ncbi:DgyrCDS10276 [Dimorphilus gyrociliatus]|uniref:DgyrCDS10276 n=1 Tax=Dimorphilus gyrociliatus TaxID=2664684 RepID=A0A7I8W2A7_9ANNE|nr:DgyrCDS10276 [Dimorphilus gyrociliatus]
MNVICWKIIRVKSGMFFFYFSLVLIPLKSYGLNETGQNFPSVTCPNKLPLPKGYVEWTDNPEKVISVEWMYGKHICESFPTCHHLGNEIESLSPQLMPVEIQPGVRLRFYPSRKINESIAFQYFKVDNNSFEICQTSGGKPLVGERTSEDVYIELKDMDYGSNYFLAEMTPELIYKCKYGLKLNVTVKKNDCQEPKMKDACWKRGRCVTHRTQKSYTCQCCPGWTGKYCEDKDACVSSPCLNDGKCLDHYGDPTGKKYNCSCKLGFTGENCESHVNNLCDKQPCLHNATCVGNRTYFECNCPPAFKGDHCEVDRNDCYSNPCINGLCIDKADAYQCYCMPGYSGRNCEINLQKCVSSPCQNGGHCSQIGSGYECFCPNGFTGEKCEIKVDLCKPSPCKNEEDCVDLGKEFKCICKNGWTGNLCEINVNECESYPCKNGGKCKDLEASFECLCFHGFSGELCEDFDVSTVGNEVSKGTFPSKINHLVIIAGTLGGAVLLAVIILSVCYFKTHGTSQIRAWKQRYFAYERHEK